MNQNEAVKFLASSFASRCYPKRLEDVNQELPFFEVKKDDSGRYDATGYNYAGHDNEPRMEYVLQYLKGCVFPNIEKACNIEGYYNIELHDAPTYLNNGKDYKDCLVFAKDKRDKTPVLIPDPYMMGNWGNQLPYINDSMPWDKKLSRLVFCGTTTGNRDPKLNQRIQTCIWALNKKHFCDFYITKIAQMDPEKVFQGVPRFDEVYRKPLSIADQIQYRYHLVMDGNTCRYDVFPYKTNTVVFKHVSNDMLWYYPMLRKGIHFAEVDKNSLENTFMFYQNNPSDASHVMYNANVFAENFFKPLVAQQYTVSLFENIGWNR